MDKLTEGNNIVKIKSGVIADFKDIIKYKVFIEYLCFKLNVLVYTL